MPDGPVVAGRDPPYTHTMAMPGEPVTAGQAIPDEPVMAGQDPPYTNTERPPSMAMTWPLT